MKTAISVPDNIYNAAEQLVTRLGESRSELYSNALKSYINQHQNIKVTEKLNEIYQTHSSHLDPVMLSSQKRIVFKNNPWSTMVGRLS